MGHTYLLRPGRDKAATTGAGAKCLQWQRPTGSCNRLGSTHSGGSPSQCLWRQGLACEERVQDGGPTFYAPLNNGASFPRQTTLPLGAFMAMEPLIPIPSGCLCAANSGPLPGFALLTSHFSTQPLPALAASCLRLGCPGLIPEEALAWTMHVVPACCQRRLWQWQHSGPWSLHSTQDSRACMGGGGLDLRGGWACSDGCPPSAHGGRRPVGGEGGCNGGPIPCTPINNGALFL